MDVLKRLRNDFIAGLLLIAPLAVTVFILRFALRRIAAVLDPVVGATRLATDTADVEVAQLLATTGLSTEDAEELPEGVAE